MLGALDDIDLDGAVVADLFAGSGALGIEALSRGAASAVLVERSPAAISVIRANLGSLGLAGLAEVVRADVVGWLAEARHFDLALVDPPYAFEGWGELLGRLDAKVAVLESDRELEVPVTWEVARHKRYGDTLVTVVRHVDVARQGQKGSP